MTLPATVDAKLRTLPSKPGVYVFRDAAGATLYVGKATSLRQRVRSYFQPGTSDPRPFVAALADTLADLETFVVASEKEAVLLESHLIRELKPLWNVRLRDDKDFLSIRVRPADPWPRLEVVRRPSPDGARYFGPYASASAARQTLRLVNRHFQLRTCTDRELGSRTRPCLQHQIKRCPAPCVLPVDRAAYGAQVGHVLLLLDGRQDELVETLTEEMRAAAAAQAYERAAVLRDQIRAVSASLEGQRVARVTAEDQDVFALHRQADHGEIAVLRVRRGRVVRVDAFALRGLREADEEVLARFVLEHYAAGVYVPHEVLVARPLEARAGIEALLSERRGSRSRLLVPRRGDRLRLVRLAEENAAHAFAEKARAREDAERRLVELADRLGLRGPPHRIECVDISHFGGADTVASVVALRDGALDRARYRSFIVRSAAAGDDYGAMREVLSRRMARGRGAEAGWEAPDLLVVDGGKGQLAVAVAVLRDLGLEAQQVVAIAKEKTTASGRDVVDRVFVPGAKNAIALRESSPALQLLALVRDEAHRASNLLRERRSRVRASAGALDRIAGIGPKTRTALLRTFGSVDAVAAASDAALAAAGISRAQRDAVRAALGGGTSEGGVRRGSSAGGPGHAPDEPLEAVEELEAHAEDVALADAFLGDEASDDANEDTDDNDIDSAEGTEGEVAPRRRPRG